GIRQADHVGVELEKDAFVGFLHSGTSHSLGIARWQRSLSERWLATASAGEDRYTQSTDVGVVAVDEAEDHRSGRVALNGAGRSWTARLGADGDRVNTSIAGEVPERGGDFGGVSGASSFLVSHDDWRLGLFGIATHTAGRLTTEAGVRTDRFHAAETIT